MQPQWPKRPRLNLHFKSVYVYNDDGCCLMHDVNYYHKIIIRLKHVIELVYCSIVVPDAAAECEWPQSAVCTQDVLFLLRPSSSSFAQCLS